MPKPLGYLPPLNPAGASAPAGSLPIAAPPLQPVAVQAPAPQMPAVVVPTPPPAPVPYAQPKPTGHAEADAILAAAHANGVVGWTPPPAPTIAPPPKPVITPAPPVTPPAPFGETPPLAGTEAANRFSAAAQSLVGEYCGPAGCARAVDKIAKLAGIPVPNTENAGEFERQLAQPGSGWIQVPASEADSAQIVTMKGAGGPNNPSGRHVEAHIGGGRTVGDPGRSSGYKIRTGSLPKNDPTAKFWKFTGDMTGPIQKGHASTLTNEYGEPGAKPNLLTNQYGEPSATAAQQLAAGAHHSQSQPRKVDGTFKKGKPKPVAPASIVPQGHTSFQDWLNNTGQIIKAGVNALPEIGADIQRGAGLFKDSIINNVRTMPQDFQNLGKDYHPHEMGPDALGFDDHLRLPEADKSDAAHMVAGVVNPISRAANAPGGVVDKLAGPDSLPAQLTESMAKKPVYTTAAISGAFGGASSALGAGASLATGAGKIALGDALASEAAAAHFFSDPLNISGLIGKVARKVEQSTASASIKAQPGDFVQSAKDSQTYGRVVGVTGKGPTKSYVVETPYGTKKVPWHDIQRHAPMADIDAIVADNPELVRVFGTKGRKGYNFHGKEWSATTEPGTPASAPRALAPPMRQLAAPAQVPPAAPEPPPAAPVVPPPPVVPPAAPVAPEEPLIAPQLTASAPPVVAPQPAPEPAPIPASPAPAPAAPVAVPDVPLHERTRTMLDPNSTAEALGNLTSDTDRDIRSGVADHPNSTPAVLSKLVNDPDPLVRSHAALNPNADESVLAPLAKDADVTVRGCVANNKNASAEVLHDLAKDADPAVRDNVASNPNTKKEDLLHLSTDPDADVRKAAMANPAYSAEAPAPAVPAKPAEAPAAAAPAKPAPVSPASPIAFSSARNSPVLEKLPVGPFEPTSSKVFTKTGITPRKSKHTQSVVLVGKANPNSGGGVQATHVVIAATIGPGPAPLAKDPIWSVYAVDPKSTHTIPNTSTGMGEMAATGLNRKAAITLAKSLSAKRNIPAPAAPTPAPAAPEAGAPPAVTPEAQAAAQAFREKSAAPAPVAPTLPPHTRTHPGSAPADIMPPKATIAKAKGEKVDPRTGMTPTQSQFLIEGLQKAMPSLPDKAQTVSTGTGSATTLAADTNVTIQVPDDGRFTVGGKDQAKALINKISKPSAEAPRQFGKRKPPKPIKPGDPEYEADYHNTQEVLRAKQLKGQAFERRNGDGSVHLTEGSPVSIPGAQDHNFFVFEYAGKHHVAEMTSGFTAGSGDTKPLALENAQKNIETANKSRSGGFAEVVKNGLRDPKTRAEREPVNQGYQPKPAPKPKTAGAPKASAPVAGKPLPEARTIPTAAEEAKATAKQFVEEEDGYAKIPIVLSQESVAKAARVIGDFVTEAKNFTSNLNMTHKYGSRKLAVKVNRLASFKARAAVLMNGAYGKIIQQMPRTTNAGEFFNMIMIESQLRGIRERWQDLSADAANAPDAALIDSKTLPDGTTITRMASTWKVPIEALSDTRKQYRGLDDEANRFAMDGDVDGLRKLLSKAFEDAADTTATMPLKPGEFDAAMADPAFQNALAIWKRDFAAELATTHATNEGVFRTNFGPADAYYPLIRADENGEPIHSPSPGGEFAKPKNTQNNFATGQSENYDYSVKGLENNVRGALKRNATADMMRQLEEEDLLQPVKNIKVTKAKTPHEMDKRTIEIRGHDYPATVVTTSKPRMIVSEQGLVSIGAKEVAAPAWLVREMGPLLHTSLPEWGGTPIGLPEPVRKIIGAVNNSALIAGPEAIYHTKNLLSTAISEVIPEGLMGKVLGASPMSKAAVTVAQISNTNPMSEENIANMREMAEAGVIPDRYGNETRDKLIAEVTGAHLNRWSLAPELFGRTGVDIRSRLYAWRQAKATFGLDPDAPLARDANGEFADPKMVMEMVERVSHFGVYNRALEGSLQRFLKDTGMAPWATAATTMTKNGIRLWTNTLNFKDIPGGSTGKRVAASTYLKMSAGIPGLVAFWAIWHHQVTGKWPWEDRHSRLLQIPISKEIQTSEWGKKVLPQHGKIYISVAGLFNPLAGRGASALGIQGAYDTYQRTHNKEQAQEAAMRGPLNAGLHIGLGGPFASNAFRLATGDEPYITSLTQGKGRRQRVGAEFMTVSHDHVRHGAGPQLIERGQSALGNINSFVHMYAEGDDNPALKDSNKVAGAVFQLSGTLKTERPSGGRLRGGMGVGSMKTKL